MADLAGMDRKLTVECSDGTEVEFDAEPCKFCGGSGTMRESKTLRMVLFEEDEREEVEQHVIVGERCPACVGRGLIATLGRRLDG